MLPTFCSRRQCQRRASDSESSSEAQSHWHRRRSLVAASWSSPPASPGPGPFCRNRRRVSRPAARRRAPRLPRRRLGGSVAVRRRLRRGNTPAAAASGTLTRDLESWTPIVTFSPWHWQSFELQVIPRPPAARADTGGARVGLGVPVGCITVTVGQRCLRVGLVYLDTKVHRLGSQTARRTAAGGRSGGPGPRHVPTGVRGRGFQSPGRAAPGPGTVTVTDAGAKAPAAQQQLGPESQAPGPAYPGPASRLKLPRLAAQLQRPDPA